MATIAFVSKDFMEMSDLKLRGKGHYRVSLQESGSNFLDLLSFKESETQVSVPISVSFTDVLLQSKAVPLEVKLSD